MFLAYIYEAEGRACMSLEEEASRRVDPRVLVWCWTANTGDHYICCAPDSIPQGSGSVTASGKKRSQTTTNAVQK